MTEKNRSRHGKSHSWRVKITPGAVKIIPGREKPFLTGKNHFWQVKTIAVAAKSFPERTNTSRLSQN
jgi:hypothetical protein